MTRTPLARLLERVLGDPPLSIRAYDNSSTSPTGSVGTIVLRGPKALSYLVTAPGSLGLARAYVSGELEVEGDLHAVLSSLWSSNIAELSWTDRLDAVRNLDRQALRWVQPPASEVGRRRVLNGLRHSKQRDAEAISHHYDVSNEFYEYVLGPSMA